MRLTSPSLRYSRDGMPRRTVGDVQQSRQERRPHCALKYQIHLGPVGMQMPKAATLVVLGLESSAFLAVLRRY